MIPSKVELIVGHYDLKSELPNNQVEISHAAFVKEACPAV
jgi:hypothetical protein